MKLTTSSMAIAMASILTIVPNLTAGLAGIPYLSRQNQMKSLMLTAT
jgi:hypothetical protein